MNGTLNKFEAFTLHFWSEHWNMINQSSSLQVEHKPQQLIPKKLNENKNYDGKSEPQKDNEELFT